MMNLHIHSYTSVRTMSHHACSSSDWAAPLPSTASANRLLCIKGHRGDGLLPPGVSGHVLGLELPGRPQRYAYWQRGGEWDRYCSPGNSYVVGVRGRCVMVVMVGLNKHRTQPPRTEIHALPLPFSPWHAVPLSSRPCSRILAAQVLIRWSLQHGFVCIPKSATASRIRENFLASQLRLSSVEMEVCGCVAPSNTLMGRFLMVGWSCMPMNINIYRSKLDSWEAVSADIFQYCGRVRNEVHAVRSFRHEIALGQPRYARRRWMLWTETFGTASDTNPAITTARTRLGEGFRMENGLNDPSDSC